MAAREKGRRRLKKEIRSCLAEPDFQKSMEMVTRPDPQKTVNALFGLFYEKEPVIRWKAVSAMGRVVARMAENSMESARVVMRRFMWNLNDESGGIGWGSPEAMAETCALHPDLAKEFHRIVISYVREDGNYLEHIPLQKGALWGAGRLAGTRPELMADLPDALIPFLASDDPDLCGLALWAAPSLFACFPEKSSALIPLIQKKKDDTKIITIYLDGVFTSFRTEELAKAALEQTGGN